MEKRVLTGLDINLVVKMLIFLGWDDKIGNIRENGIDYANSLLNRFILFIYL